MMYVDLDTMDICSSGFLTGIKHPGLVVKNIAAHPLTDDDLERLGAARFEEPAVEGYMRTGKAVLVGQVYRREYRDQTPAEAAAQRAGELAATDQHMPRMVEDIWQVLLDKGLVADADLPQAAQDKMNDRRAKRAAL